MTYHKAEIAGQGTSEKRPDAGFFGDLDHSWVFLTAMLADVVVKIIDIEPYTDL
jgi:hypothetical protein